MTVVQVIFFISITFCLYVLRLVVTTSNGQISFANSVGSTSTAVDGIYVESNQALPLTCSYDSDITLDIALSVETASERALERKGDYEVSETAAVNELVTIDDFDLTSPDDSPLIGQTYTFTIGFNSPLASIGFSVETCKIISGTDTGCSVNLFCIYIP